MLRSLTFRLLPLVCLPSRTGQQSTVSASVYAAVIKLGNQAFIPPAQMHQLLQSVWTWLFLLACGFLSVFGKARRFLREKSPLIKQRARQVSHGLGFLWHSFGSVGNLKALGASIPSFVIPSFGPSFSLSEIRRRGSTAFLTTVTSALNLAGYRVAPRVPSTADVATTSYKTVRQKRFDGLFAAHRSGDAVVEDEEYDRPPMIESPATSRKTLAMPATFDAYSVSIATLWPVIEPRPPSPPKAPKGSSYVTCPDSLTLQLKPLLQCPPPAKAR